MLRCNVMVLVSNICVLKCNIWVLASGVGVLRCNIMVLVSGVGVETVQKSVERGMFLPSKNNCAWLL